MSLRHLGDPLKCGQTHTISRIWQNLQPVAFAVRRYFVRISTLTITWGTNVTRRRSTFLQATHHPWFCRERLAVSRVGVYASHGVNTRQTLRTEKACHLGQFHTRRGTNRDKACAL